MKNSVLSIICVSLLLLSACDGKQAKLQNEAGEERQEVITDSPGEPGELEPEDTVASRPLTLALAGDIMMGTTFPEDGDYITPDDGATLFDDVSPILQRVDIAAGNLEGVLFDGVGKPKDCPPESLCFAFKMPARYATHLVKAGFDFVGIANNHINDFGREALDTTMRVLERSGIAYAGFKSKKPVAVIEKDGRKIGFAAFGFNGGMPSVNNYDEVRANIGKLRGECDFVIVSFHGGGEGKEFQHVPHKREITSADRGNVEEFAHVAVDAGADVVFGHSPHVPRAVELYKDRIIFYSLGNFCTPYRFNLEGVNGLAPLPEITLNPDGSFAEGVIHSFLQLRGTGPKRDASNRAALKIRELTLEDFPDTRVTVSETGRITKK